MLDLDLYRITISSLHVLTIHRRQRIRILDHFRSTLRQFRLVRRRVANTKARRRLSTERVIRVRLNGKVRIIVNNAVRRTMICVALLYTRLSLIVPRLRFNDLQRNVQRFRVKDRTTVNDHTTLALSVHLTN